jgi:hypothetical protein
LAAAGTASAGSAVALATMERRERFDIAAFSLSACECTGAGGAPFLFLVLWIGHGAPCYSVRCGQLASSVGVLLSCVQLEVASTKVLRARFEICVKRLVGRQRAPAAL